jgi:hypothetical protein
MEELKRIIEIKLNSEQQLKEQEYSKEAVHNRQTYINALKWVLMQVERLEQNKINTHNPLESN